MPVHDGHVPIHKNQVRFWEFSKARSPIQTVFRFSGIKSKRLQHFDKNTANRPGIIDDKCVHDCD